MCASYQLKPGEVAHNSHAAPVNEDLRLPCAAPNFFPQPKKGPQKASGLVVGSLFLVVSVAAAVGGVVSCG